MIAWVGEEAKIDERAFEILDAQDVVSLQYVQNGADADPVFLNAAVWTNPDNLMETCPHHPGVCYSGNGWQLIEQEKLEIETSAGIVHYKPCSLKERNASRVGFCYEMGEKRFVSDNEARITQLSLWGKEKWPSELKFLLQAYSSDIESAKPKLELFSRKFFEWWKSTGPEI